MRTILDDYPDYTAELEEIRESGITKEILTKIINKHSGNSAKTRLLYDRYRTMDHAVPIYTREPRYHTDGGQDPINNKVMNDFFSEIVDVKVGYFAGNPIAYGYSDTTESEEETGSEESVKKAKKAVSDFVTRNNMLDIDMETTKVATICGYAGRLFYIDKDGNERVMVTMPYETIVLSESDMTEPEYAVRYMTLQDINEKPFFRVEFYDEKNVVTYEGGDLKALEEVGTKPHLFDYCPLQGVPNNLELMGDTEKVQELIDAYDRAVSDSNNEIESFSNAYMVFENINIDEKDIAKAQQTGAIKFYSGGSNGKVYFLTKQVDDGFIEHHLDRLEGNIYRFSKTPNLSDESFGTASGVALKFKITGLETKCGMFEAKMKSAATYMFKLLASAWRKKTISCDPLQCTLEFKRNFPLDLTSEAQAAATLIGCGLPKEVVFSQLSFIDDISYVMQKIEEEQAGILPLDDEDDDNEDNNNVDETETDEMKEKEENNAQNE
jgi:SPP1 family phage portal protein